LRQLVHLAAYAQMDYYRYRGLRDRLLNLPTMLALVLAMVWRQIGSVCELVRLLSHEGLLWTEPMSVRQQALSKRLLCFPAGLFERVLRGLQPGCGGEPHLLHLLRGRDQRWRVGA